MGQKMSAMIQKERFYDAIVCDEIESVNKYLEKDATLVHMKFNNGKTTPLCRAACLGHNAMVQLLLRFGADINTPSSDGNTPVMWAAHQNHIELVKFFLMQQGIDVEAVNERGSNLLDVAINRMRYHIAVHVMEKTELRPKDKEFYEEHQFFNFNVESFLESLEEAREVHDVNGFLKPDSDEEDDDGDSDKVPDPREGWASWIKRVVKFQKKPMVKRNSLPDHLQPQNSLAGKLRCLVHGVNPIPPRRLEETEMTATNRTSAKSQSQDEGQAGPGLPSLQVDAEAEVHE